MNKEELLDELAFVCRLINIRRNKEFKTYKQCHRHKMSFGYYIGQSVGTDGYLKFYCGYLHDLYLKADTLVGQIKAVDNFSIEGE
jgi:hypothetical protein